MNLSDIFIKRNPSYIQLNKVADYLGRVLRENAVIFSIDGASNSVIFLTEDEKLVSAEYKMEDEGVSLTNIVVNTTDSVLSDEAVDGFVAEEVSNLVGTLRSSDYHMAKQSFSNIVEVLTNRHEINETRANLEDKLSKFSSAQNILDTPEFKNLSELKDNIKKFIKVNIETLSENLDLVNSIKLNSALGRVFETPKLTYEQLIEKGLYVPYNNEAPLYEMVCRRELISRELYESKRSFATMWISNEALKTLAESYINEDIEPNEALIAVIRDVPYFALASKSEINEALTKIYDIDFNGQVSKKNIKDFVSYIFEAKKPAKKETLKVLSESYGININNLKFSPTFAELSLTQASLFELLGNSTDEDGELIKTTCTEFSNLIKRKRGIEVLDVCDFIDDIFKESFKELVKVNVILAEVSMEGVADLAATAILESAGYYQDNDEEMEVKGEKEKKGKGKKVKGKGKEKGEEKEVEDEDEDEDEDDKKKDEKKKPPFFNKDKDSKDPGKDEIDDTEQTVPSKKALKDEKKKKKVVKEGAPPTAAPPVPGKEEEVDAVAQAGLEPAVDQDDLEAEEDGDEEVLGDLTEDELRSLIDDAEEILSSMSLTTDVEDEEEL